MGQLDIKKKITIDLTKPPKKYKFLFLNDDYTPVDFVWEIFKHYFNLSQTEAQKKAEEIHTKGQGLIDKAYTLDIAQTKAHQLKQVIKVNRYQLQFEIIPQENE